MKTLFIEAQRKLKLDREKLNELEKLLPDTIYIAYSIQYEKLAEEVRKQLRNKKILGFRQVLGCSQLKTNAKVVLLIGSGRFHALALASSCNKEVYIFPEMNKIEKSEIETMKARERGKYARFLAAEKVGILVSSKPGQQNLQQALRIKKAMRKAEKKPYLFMADNINIAELENFPCDIFINTACPGLVFDSSKIINHRGICQN